jgi:hypothetical protein
MDTVSAAVVEPRVSVTVRENTSVVPATVGGAVKVGVPDVDPERVTVGPEVWDQLYVCTPLVTTDAVPSRKTVE